MFLRFLLAGLILIVIGQTPFTGHIRGVAAKVSNPLQYGAYGFSQNLRGELDFIVHLRRLRGENLRLVAQVLDLESKLVTLGELQHENNLLREQLEVSKDSTPKKLILAEIVGRSTGSGEAVMTINRGSSSGVKKGASVILKDFLLGEVSLVESERAKVRLLTDPRFSAAALDQDSPNRARGLVSGQYGTTVVLQKVLPTETLGVGDTVITSGEDEKFGEGLILGRVRKILGEEAEVFKGAELDLMVDFGLLEEVFVVWQ